MDSRSLWALARAQGKSNRHHKFFLQTTYIFVSDFVGPKKKSKPNRKKSIPNFFAWKKWFSKKSSKFSKKLIFFENQKSHFFRSFFSRFFKISNIFTFFRNFKIFKIQNLQDKKIFSIQFLFWVKVCISTILKMYLVTILTLGYASGPRETTIEIPDIS